MRRVGKRKSATRAVSGPAGSDPLGGLPDSAKSGLVDRSQPDSWGGTGDHRPLGPDQVEQGVPDAIPDQVVTDAGVSGDRAADRAAQELPQVMAEPNPTAGPWDDRAPGPHRATAGLNDRSGP